MPGGGQLGGGICLPRAFWIGGVITKMTKFTPPANRYRGSAFPPPGLRLNSAPVYSPGKSVPGECFSSPGLWWKCILPRAETLGGVDETPPSVFARGRKHSPGHFACKTTCDWIAGNLKMAAPIDKINSRGRDHNHMFELKHGTVCLGNDDWLSEWVSEWVSAPVTRVKRIIISILHLTSYPWIRKINIGPYSWQFIM